MLSGLENPLHILLLCVVLLLVFGAERLPRWAVAGQRHARVQWPG